MLSKTDLKTQGNYQGVYGGDGCVLAGGAVMMPKYATVSHTGDSYTWTPSTNDPRALDGVAACWFGTGNFAVDINITDGATHQLAAYFLDWDSYLGGRVQSATLRDAASGAVLDSQVLSGFRGGVYLVWNISGHVVLTVANSTVQGNAVLSGLFFGTSGASGRQIGGIPFFPPDYFCNSPVNRLPYDVLSDALVASLGDGHLQPDPEFFINLANNKTPTPKLTFAEGSEVSDAGSYPITGDMVVSVGGEVAVPPLVKAKAWPGDAHLLAINTDTKTLYELYHFSGNAEPYACEMGCWWALDDYRLRPVFKSGKWVTDDSTGITSASAAGTPIAPLVYTFAELSAAVEPPSHMGRICFGFGQIKPEAQWPANHMISHCSGQIPMGAIFVLSPDFDVVTRPDGKKYTPQVSRMLKWLQINGALLDDIGTPGLVGMDLDPRMTPDLWAAIADDLHQVEFKRFHIVDTREWIIDVSSGQVNTGFVRR